MSTQPNVTLKRSIKEVAKLSGLSEPTLRYYETMGIIESIERDSDSGYRSYNETDVANIDIIACLSATGMSIDAMRTYMRNRDAREDKTMEQIQLLEAQRVKIKEEAKALELREHYTTAKIEYWHAIKQNDAQRAFEILENLKPINKKLKFQATK